MTQSLCAVTVSVPETWDNRSGPGYQPGPNPPLALTERQAAMQAIRECSVEGCERVHYARGTCNVHYERMRTRGSTDLLPAPSAAERLRSRLNPTDSGCLEWTGCADRKGYGSIRRGSRSEGKVLVHRLAWELANGPIPEGMCVCHRCDNPPCCNVGHLFLGTKADNNADMAAKGRARNSLSRRAS